MYDLIIIGAGPAGLAASIYASRYRLKHLVLGSQLGGAMAWASQVENYPGFSKISGLELTNKLVEQVKSLGGEIRTVGVARVSRGQGYQVGTEDDKVYSTRTLIIATGMQRRKLGVPGETEYLGKGVSYCVTCDAAFFKDKVAAVIGGSNAAAMGAAHLVKFARKVYLIYRGEKLRADPIWQERLEKEKKVEIIYQANVVKILGEEEFIKTKNQKPKTKNNLTIEQKVGGVELDKSYKNSKYLLLDGVFIEIGGAPGNELAKSLGVELDEKGYIKVGPDMATNVPGVFAAGDIANAAGELQQIVTAVSEGAIAATSAFKLVVDKER